MMSMWLRHLCRRTVKRVDTACRNLAETACTGDCAMFDGVCLPTVAKFNSLGYDDEPGSNVAVRTYRCGGLAESVCTDASTCYWEMIVVSQNLPKLFSRNSAQPRWLS